MDAGDHAGIDGITMGRLRFWLGSLITGLVVSSGSVTVAAERIVFRFGELARDVSVPELRQFSETGAVAPELQPILQRLKPAEQLALRRVLSQPLPVDEVSVSNLLSTPLGRRSLQQLVKVLDQPASVAEPALSSALVLGAAKPGGLRLINVLEAYPTQRLPVNVAAVLSLEQSLTLGMAQQEAMFDILTSGKTVPVAGSELTALSVEGSIPFRQIPFQFQGRDGERISAIAYLPETSTAASPAPLVAIAPGLNSNMNALLYVGRHLASHGYAVASLNFPFTSADAVQAVIQGTALIPPVNAWFAQPLDVSALIDQVEQRWGARVDTQRVGVLGQSLGGYTVTALAGAELDWAALDRQCLQLSDPKVVVLNPAMVWQCSGHDQVSQRKSFRDPRVKVAVAVNPVTNPIFSATSIQALAVPILMVSGSNDIFAPSISQQLIPFSWIQQPGSLLVLQRNGTHLSFLEGTSDLPPKVLGPDLPLARRQLKGMARGFFDQLLRLQPVMPSLLPTPTDPLVAAGRDPLKLLVMPRLSRQQLERVAPGLDLDQAAASGL
ncbi:alpha/beta hydrolase family protein [Synechococcus sp. A18-25c]|uniref:alpha/beta hydrolase n=1 Tax=Synechococcus sp. A18-25c TaxID=1866938 RepID=UPI0018625BBD|nr:alpha/beta hydrolase [Synechococcus sp. A18-25c]QNJ21247.1 alpha/beta hydrolase family protein [Synechococcus sp. A18-25c]